jgi:hypothetical protein
MHEHSLLNTIVVLNPQHIPRVGENIDMGITPAPKVSKVLWDYKKTNQTDVYVIVA